MQEFARNVRDHRSSLEISAGVWIDARRAVWIEREKVLAVADLHLGYAWAHRHGGQMLPLSAKEDTIDRLLALVGDYQPQELAILGDIVHQAVPVKALEEEIARLCAEFGGQVALRLMAGNHDRALAPLLTRCGIDLELLPFLERGAHLLLHGDDKGPNTAAKSRSHISASGGRIFMGHEHPAIRIGDGVASVKCPCFLVSPQLVILPAFSAWAAGANVRPGEFLSTLANGEKFQTGYAILAGKLLQVRL